MIEHHCFSESIERKFGGVIGRATAERILAGQARDIDDEAAATTAKKTRQRFARTVERPIQVQFNIAVPVLVGHVRHFAEDPFAGVVYQYVQRAEFAIDGSEKLSHCLYLSDVGSV